MISIQYAGRLVVCHPSICQPLGSYSHGPPTDLTRTRNILPFFVENHRLPKVKEVFCDCGAEKWSMLTAEAKSPPVSPRVFNAPTLDAGLLTTMWIALSRGTGLQQAGIRNDWILSSGVSARLKVLGRIWPKLDRITSGRERNARATAPLVRRTILRNSAWMRRISCMGM